MEGDAELAAAIALSLAPGDGAHHGDHLVAQLVEVFGVEPSEAAQILNEVCVTVCFVLIAVFFSVN